MLLACSAKSQGFGAEPSEELLSVDEILGMTFACRYRSEGSTGTILRFSCELCGIAIDFPARNPYVTAFPERGEWHEPVATAEVGLVADHGR